MVRGGAAGSLLGSASSGAIHNSKVHQHLPSMQRPCQQVTLIALEASPPVPGQDAAGMAQRDWVAIGAHRFQSV